MSLPISFISFFKTFPLLHFNAGERILRPNEYVVNIVYVKSGAIRVYQYSKEGKEISLYCLAKKDYENFIFGYSAQLNDYSIDALTDVELWKIQKSAFVEFLRQNSAVNESFIEGLYYVIKALLMQIEWLKDGDSNKRIIKFLELLASDFSQEKNGKLVIDFRIKHQAIADYTGLTRETVSIRLKKLREKGIIEYNDAILTILDMQSLKKEIDN